MSDMDQPRQEWPLQKMITTIATALVAAAIGWSAASTVELKADVQELRSKVVDLRTDVRELSTKLDAIRFSIREQNK